MLSLAILLILIFGFFVGLKRGFILQVIHLVGSIIAFIVAYLKYDELSAKLTLWIPYPSFTPGSELDFIFGSGDFEKAYYRAIAFVAIFFGVKIVLQIIGSMLDFVAGLPVLKTLNTWAGAALGFIEVYLLVFIVLYIAALLPIDFIQNLINKSLVATLIIEHTPIISSLIRDWWIGGR